MTFFDEARTIKAMLAMQGESQRRLADRLGVSQSYVANKLRLLGFSEGEEKAITEGGLTERHARALLRLSGERRAEALEKTIARGLTVRECEALVDFLHDGEAPERIRRAESGERLKKFTETIEESVRTLRSLGIDISISRSFHGRRSYITLSFAE